MGALAAALHALWEAAVAPWLAPPLPALLLLLAALAAAAGEAAARISARIALRAGWQPHDWRRWRARAGAAALVAQLCCTALLGCLCATSIVATLALLGALRQQFGAAANLPGLFALVAALGATCWSALGAVGYLSLVNIGGVPLSISTPDEPYDRLPRGLRGPDIARLLVFVAAVQLAALALGFGVAWVVAYGFGLIDKVTR